MSVVVQVEPDQSTLETSLWCSTCMLPSGFAIWFVRIVMTDEGVARHPIDRVEWCPTHGQQPVAPRDK